MVRESIVAWYGVYNVGWEYTGRRVLSDMTGRDPQKLLRLSHLYFLVPKGLPIILICARSASY